jgi:hypothetical protein
MLTRLMGLSGGLARAMGPGDSLLSPAPYVISADAADTVTVEKINAGIIQYTGFTAGRVLTTDTAANIIAAFPELGIGESLVIAVSAVAAFAATWAAGAGVTLAGRATTPASSYSLVVITKTGAATVGWRVL